VNFKRVLLNNFITRSFVNKLLPHMPRRLLQEFMGDESLSPIEQFSFHGYNDLLYSNINLNREDLVVVLGGFQGISVNKWRDKFDCWVVAVEPIATYVTSLKQNFQDDSKVKVLEFAVSDRDDYLELGIEGESTGSNAVSGSRVRVPCRDISRVLLELDQFPKVVEMNIEGGEYSCLDSLLTSKVIRNIDTLLIQFHRYSNSDELQRAKLRVALEESHECIFEFPWVWERWDRKS
jgi:FkbM family methyltransferase